MPTSIKTQQKDETKQTFSYHTVANITFLTKPELKSFQFD